MSELYEKSFLKLELDQVLAQLAECAGSEEGKAACLRLRPVADLEDVQAMLDETTAASNFITKKEAQELGWSGGSLEPYAPGKCIGGNRFGNYEGLLPEKNGRKYTECDIDTLGKSKRGAKRIVFSNDGLIYYTDNHYESFTLLYGEETS